MVDTCPKMLRFGAIREIVDGDRPKKRVDLPDTVPSLA
jgi:hypothetical protein